MDTDDPRCLKIQSFKGLDSRGIMQDEAVAYKGFVRARGLDSCFSLGYDSTDVFIYKPRWLYRIKHSKDTTFREADELLKGGQ